MKLESARKLLAVWGPVKQRNEWEEEAGLAVGLRGTAHERVRREAENTGRKRARTEHSL